jgi:hypothetical protein
VAGVIQVHRPALVQAQPGQDRGLHGPLHVDRAQESDITKGQARLLDRAGRDLHEVVQAHLGQPPPHGVRIGDVEQVPAGGHRGRGHGCRRAARGYLHVQAEWPVGQHRGLQYLVGRMAANQQGRDRPVPEVEREPRAVVGVIQEP